MCSAFQIQLAILNAKLMVIGLYITCYTCFIWGLGIITLGTGNFALENLVNYTVPLDYLFLLYSIFMVKGVGIKKNYYLTSVICY